MKKILKRCEEAINKLTYKQCKKIITIVVISAAILMLGIVIFLCSYNKQPITNWLLSLLTGVIGIPLMVGALTWILLATEWKQQEENEIKVRPEVRKRFKLSQTEFVEVEPKEATEPFEIIFPQSIQIYCFFSGLFRKG